MNAERVFCRRANLPAREHLSLRNHRKGAFRLLTTRAAAATPEMFAIASYNAPEWSTLLDLVPKTRVQLAQIPTPIHRWNVPGVSEGAELWIKRDDLTGCQLSGNKVRKLEFIFAEVLQSGADSVVTIGGIQSNHCRATAVAARYLGLECHLILRTSEALLNSDPGLVGNLLLDRMTGAHIHLVSKEEYGRYGQVLLGQTLVEQLKKEGKKPFLIPVGGSSALGCWGYLEMVRELESQWEGQGFTDIAMACGSGGTTAGIALGNYLAGNKLRVHAYGVCDDAAYFHSCVDDLYQQLGAVPSRLGGATAKDTFRCVQAKGAGYALSRPEELQSVRDVALSTGVVLDPVYTGKAVHALLQDMADNAQEWQGRKVLFVHTGGLLGLYDKAQQMQGLVQPLDRCQRLQLD